MREGGIAEPKYKEATGGTNQSKWGHVELPKSEVHGNACFISVLKIPTEL